MGQFFILFVDGTGDARLPAAAAVTAAAIARRGIEGVSVVARSVAGRPTISPADFGKVREWLWSVDQSGACSSDPVEVPPLLSPEELEAAELVFTFDETVRDDLIEMGAGRAYTILDYLGRPTEPIPPLGVEAFEAVAIWIDQLVEQVLYELETDPARPGGLARK